MKALLLLLFALLTLPVRAEAGAVAVLYFDNQGNPELEPLKIGLAQMLITDLSRDGELVVVERARLQAVLDELQLGHDGTIDPKTAARVGKLLGAELLVMGAYFELMGTMRVDARVVRVETGEIVASHGLSDRPEQFLTIEQTLATQLRESLRGAVGRAPTPDPGTRAQGAAAAATATPAPIAATSASVVIPADEDAIDAAVAFSQGLIHLDRKDVPRAREAFEKAVVADPNLAAAREELARLEL